MSGGQLKDMHVDLTPIDLENLFNIISQSNCSLDQCYKTFAKDLGPDLFKACHVLYNLLLENVRKI